MVQVSASSSKPYTLLPESDTSISTHRELCRVTCQVYVMEICPNRIRGGMVTFQSVWYVSPRCDHLGFSVADHHPKQEQYWWYYLRCHDATAQPKTPRQLSVGYANPLGSNWVDDRLLDPRSRVTLVPRPTWQQGQGLEGHEAALWWNSRLRLRRGVRDYRENDRARERGADGGTECDPRLQRS